LKAAATPRGTSATLRGGLSAQPCSDALDDRDRLDTPEAREDHRTEAIDKGDNESAQEQGLGGGRRVVAGHVGVEGGVRGQGAGDRATRRQVTGDAIRRCLPEGPSSRRAGQCFRRCPAFHLARVAEILRGGGWRTRSRPFATTGPLAPKAGVASHGSSTTGR